MARMLITTSVLENVNQLVRIRINCMVFTIKLVEEPFTNPYVHIGDMYNMRSGSIKVPSLSSESDDSEEMSFEASIAATRECEFKNFLNDDLEVNDHYLFLNGDEDMGVNDGEGFHGGGSKWWDRERERERGTLLLEKIWDMRIA